ncbi:MAG: glycosyltransferase family 4 protein [Tannerellaceae bacterium]|jgi:glycosyltransferase involved in cell wall biosynthesis|nr:glycosyltransferase family 4 protein [Tannerellaceae bacterium]
MKIIFDCERMKHPYTGLSEYCSQLGKALQSTAADNEVAFYVPPGYKNYFGHNSRYHIYSSIHKIFPLRVRQTDVWHTNSQRPLIKSGYGMKRIITIHDLNFLYEKPSQAKIKKYLKAFQGNIDRADAVITISGYAKTDIVNHLRLNGKPVFVVYNGCNVREFPGYDRPVYRPEAPFLFSLGTVLPKKNFHVLPCLIRNNDYELIIAGKGSDKYARQIMEKAAEYRVADRVRLIGPVSDKDKYWYLKNCTAFLFPSIAEGFGIPPVEAMHFGKPVFLSALTSLPETGGRYAYYFNDFDPESMRETFESGMDHYIKTRPEAMIIQHAGRFSWEKSAKACWDIYKSALL